MAQQDCVTAVRALNAAAGPLQERDATGVVAATKAANADLSQILAGNVENDAAITEYTAAVGDAQDLLAAIAVIETPAVLYEDGMGAWSVVTTYEFELPGFFKALDSACSAIGVTIRGYDSQAASPSPASSPSFTLPYSAGCPSSDQLLAAWNASPASARGSWLGGTVPTGFTGTQCWHQWVVSNPVVQANGTVIFTDTNGQLAVFPETDLSEFDAAICGVPGIGAVWSTPAMGPASCS